MLHDPNVYPHPDEFRPERFLTPDGQLDPSVRDPALVVFGFGRRFVLYCNSVESNPDAMPLSKRICPGRHFAVNSLFISVTSVLHIYDISPPIDDEGQRIVPKVRMRSGLVS